MQNQGCYFHAEGGKTILAFSTFLISPRISKEIDVYLTPTKATKLDFDELTTPQINTKQQSGIIKSNYHQKQFNFIHRDVNSYPIKDEQKQCW